MRGASVPEVIFADRNQRPYEPTPRIRYEAFGCGVAWILVGVVAALATGLGFVLLFRLVIGMGVGIILLAWMTASPGASLPRAGMLVLPEWWATSEGWSTLFRTGYLERSLFGPPLALLEGSAVGLAPDDPIAYVMLVGPRRGVLGYLDRRHGSWVGFGTKGLPAFAAPTPRSRTLVHLEQTEPDAYSPWDVPWFLPSVTAPNRRELKRLQSPPRTPSLAVLDELSDAFRIVLYDDQGRYAGAAWHRSRDEAMRWLEGRARAVRPLRPEPPIDPAIRLADVARLGLGR